MLGIVNGKKIEYFCNDNDSEVYMISNAWNNAYHEQYCTSDDMDSNAIYDSIMKKVERRYNP